MLCDELYRHVSLIYYSDKIDIIDKYIVVILFFLHWIPMIFISSYYFLRGTKCHWFILVYLCFFIVTWFLIYKDCIFSYYEKEILFGKGVFDFDAKYMANPSMALYMKINIFTILLFCTVIVFTLYAFYRALVGVGLPSIFVAPVIGIFFMFIMYYRWQEYLLIDNQI